MDVEYCTKLKDKLIVLKKLALNSVSFDKETFINYINYLLTLSGTGNISEEVDKLINIVDQDGTGDAFYRQLIRMLSLIDNNDKSYESVVDVFEDIYANSDPKEGISFLCSFIDELTGGISEGELCTILGASGSMKTTYSSNIAYNAVKQGKNVIYLSLEEQPIQLYSKWLSRASIDAGRPLPVKEIIQHNLEEKDRTYLLNEVTKYFKSLDGNLYIIGEQDLWDYSLQSLEEKFREVDKLAREQSGHGIDLLVVDHIQLIKFAVTSMDPTNVINMYVSFFRQQCLSWLHEKRSIAIILLSQANREGLVYAQHHDGLYLAQHVAEASEIIRASSHIISVYTDPVLQLSSLLKVGCVKLRGAQLPEYTINIYADGASYRVGDLVPKMKDYSLSDLIELDDNTNKQRGIVDLSPLLPELGV